MCLTIIAGPLLDLAEGAAAGGLSPAVVLLPLAACAGGVAALRFFLYSQLEVVTASMLTRYVPKGKVGDCSCAVAWALWAQGRRMGAAMQTQRRLAWLRSFWGIGTAPPAPAWLHMMQQHGQQRLTGSS